MTLSLIMLLECVRLGFSDSNISYEKLLFMSNNFIVIELIVLLFNTVNTTHLASFSMNWRQREPWKHVTHE